MKRRTLKFGRMMQTFFLFSKWFHWHIDYRQRRRNLEFECTKRIRFEVVTFAANKSLTNPNYHRMSVAILYEKLMPIWDFRNINQHFFFLIFLFEILTESRSQQNFIHFHFHSYVDNRSESKSSECEGIKVIDQSVKLSKTADPTWPEW